MHAHLQTLPEGALDIVGDVHGESQALESLLQYLGYPLDAPHPQGRHLVFVGDLVDRGPDSPGTLRLVRQLQELGGAQCLLGNHELNLLLGKERSGNAWFYGKTQTLSKSEQILPQVLADDAMRKEILLYLQTLPLAAQRADLRVVHACWHQESIAQLEQERRSLLDLFYETEQVITESMLHIGHGKNSVVADLARQNKNPVTTLTSGLEEETDQPFRAGGRLRKVSRVAWWESYQSEIPVVFGHFWRALDAEHPPVKKGPYLFSNHAFQDALGPRRNAFCIDYSVGYRAITRALAQEEEYPTALMALRWPEKVLVDDGGHPWPISR